MGYLDAVILAVVEGITEFLPISSTGHLILTNKLLGIVQSNFTKSFSIFIQLGAIAAVLFFSLKRLLGSRALYGKIITAFIPTALIGFFVYPFLKKYLLGSSGIVCVSLILGGIILVLFENWYAKKNVERLPIENITYKQSILIGLIQSLSIVPGVSRSGATIVGSMLLGLSRPAALEFSFLLAIPTMAAASGYDLLKSAASFTTNEWSILVVGFLASFISALLVVKWLLSYVQNHSFKIFGFYRIIIGILFLSFLL